ncbi:MAG: hypothetical protein JWO09_2751 [Bacteroidetes bacterium]|nr:hypothetical protein [Bacteroidota bacterium]
MTILLHELGHAIPAMLLTGGKVTIYVGSYGNRENSQRISLGKLEIWFRYNFVEWKQGLCSPHAKDISINRQIIYTLCGPLASLLVAIAMLYFAFVFNFNELPVFALIIFLASAVTDIISNLNPTPKPVELHSGKIIYNDGYALISLFRIKAERRRTDWIVHKYNLGNYKKAAELSAKLLKTKSASDFMAYRILVSSLCQLKEYERAYDYYKQFAAKYKPDAHDLSISGFLLCQLGSREEGIIDYKRSLELDPDNANTLNNLGYSLILAERYNEALPLLDRSVQLNDTFAYAFNNRGHVKLMMGLLEDGFEDICRGLSLNDTNSYGYRNRGIYYLLKNDPASAMEEFIKAKRLDPSTEFINDHIAEAKRLLN